MYSYANRLDFPEKLISKLSNQLFSVHACKLRTYLLIDADRFFVILELRCVLRHFQHALVCRGIALLTLEKNNTYVDKSRTYP